MPRGNAAGSYTPSLDETMQLCTAKRDKAQGRMRVGKRACITVCFHQLNYTGPAIEGLHTCISATLWFPLHFVLAQLSRGPQRMFNVACFARSFSV